MGRHVKRHRCSICHEKGHNIRSCPNRPEYNPGNESPDSLLENAEPIVSGNVQLPPNICLESQVLCENILFDDSSVGNDSAVFIELPVRQLAAEQIPGGSRTVVPVVFEHLPCGNVLVGVDDSIVNETQLSEFLEVEEILFNANSDISEDVDVSLETNSIEHSPVLSGSEADEVDKCRHCKRQETAELPLRLAVVIANYKKRKFGDGRCLTVDSQVCHLCNEYLNVSNSPSWGNAWPAVLYSSFVSNSIIPNKQKLVEFLPYSIRKMWADSVDNFLPAIQGIWEACAPLFADITKQVQAHKDHKRTLSLGGMIDLFNEDPFPIVRCPLGCFQFVDDLLRGELELVPGCNYIAVIDERFSAFGASSKRLSGRHPSWPALVNVLDWVVSPSIYIDPVKGLCYVQCAKSVHCSPEKQIVHVPVNPVLEYATLNPDITAPCVATTSFARCGRSNKSNSSYLVINSKGKQGGISSFSIAPKRPVINNASAVELLSWGLALSQRKDVTHFLAESSDKEREWSQGVLLSFNEHSSAIGENLIQKCKEEATFVAVGDAIHYAKSASIKVPTGNEVDGQNHKYKGVQKDVLPVVHLNNSVGQIPYDVPTFQRRMDIGDRKGCVLRAVVNSLLHCRELHRLFLKHVWDAPSGLLKRLKKLCEKISQGKRRKVAFCQQLELDLIAAVLSEHRNLDANSSVERIVSYILSFVCHVQRVEVVDGFNINNFLMGQSGVYVFDSSDSPMIREELPSEDESGMFSLKLACHVAERQHTYHDVNFAFRWFTGSKWMFFRNAKKFTLHDEIPLNEVPLFVYCSDRAEVDLARDQYILMSGGQTKIKCAIHRSPIMRERSGLDLLCGAPDCTSPLRWRCPHGHPGYQCTSGLCLKHLHESQGHAGEQFVYGRVGLPAAAGIVDVDADAGLVEVAEELFPAETNDPLDTNYDFYVMDNSDSVATLPLTTNVFESPMYLSDSSGSSSGHYLLNNCLRVMSRVSVNGSVPVCLHQILHSIYSRSPAHIVPLLYPEAVLFPKIFWNETNDAAVGALPSSLFSNQGILGVNDKFGELKDHLKIRLLDGNLLTSRDPYYISFAFDCLLNQNLNHNSISVAMRKGLEFVNKTYVVPEDREANIKFGQVDSRQKVNELSSFLKDIGHWTYFITLTCNDSETFGVAPIRRAIKRQCPDDDEKFELLLQNYCSIMCRAWERVVRHFMHFVLHSPERPMGHVKGIWYRFEFQSQGSPGNKPHVHGGVTLHPESIDLDTDLERIACRVQEIFSVVRGCDRETLLLDGILKDWDEYAKLHSLAKMLLRHNCKNSNMRCQKSTATGKRCRVPKHPHRFTYHMKPHNLYDEKTLEALQWLDLAEVTDGKWKVHDHLQGGCWHYPAEPDIIETPTIPRIFAAFRSVVNVQHCDKKFHTAYLVKYCAGEDEKRNVTFRKAETTPEVIAQTQDLYNAKISGSAFSEKSNRADDLDEPMAREICLTEMIWYSLNLPYVYTNVEFVNVPTHPVEFRACVKKMCTKAPVKLVNADHSIKSIASRQQLAPWRKFSPDQLIHIEDFCKGHYHLDRTAHFSVRPPELFLIKNLATYCRWFTWTSVKDQSVSENLSAHTLLDGAGYCVKVRLFYLEELVSFFQHLSNDLDAIVQEQAVAMHDLYAELAAAYNNGDETSQFMCRFVNVEKRLQAVVVFTSVTPFQLDKFIYHLILTLGKFDTEVGLSHCRDYREAFCLVKLVGAFPRGHDDAKAIIRRYVLEQLAFLPVSSREFSLMLASLIDYLKIFFTGGMITYDSMPLVTSRCIHEAASSELRELERVRLNNLIHSLEGHRLPNFPGRVVLERGDPAYHPVVVQIPGQSDASHLEQRTVLTVCLQAINQSLDITINFVKSILLLGPPGAGKTHILLTACVYALSRKLKSIVTALTSERARMLGGEHIHLLFSIPVETGSLNSASGITAKCLLRLARNPVKLAYLKRLDIIFVEEIGLIPAKLLAVMDLVLQRLKENVLPFGGVLLICSGDSRQLAPIGDEAIWTSNSMFTSFRTLVFKNFVRSRQDQDLQTVINLIRKPFLDDPDVTSVLNIIRTRCVPQQFVANWDAVPLNVLRVVGKKRGEEVAVKQYVDEKKKQGLQWQEHLAVDDVELMQGYWQKADKAASTLINRQVVEESNLFLHQGAVMRLTFNNLCATGNRPVFSQGQIVVVIELPDTTKTLAQQRLKVVLIPPGCRDFDPANLPPQWPTCILARRYSTAVVIGRGNLKGRREQWPLRYFVAYTVHKIIGETCSRLATQISCNDSMYRLWEREQLLVIISRVSSLDDLIFVGIVEDTFLAMKSLLEMRSLRTEHIHEVISALDELSNNCIVTNYFCQPSHGMAHVPTSRCGFVYAVMSTKNLSVWRIEEGVCLKTDLMKLNQCSFHIDSCLRPWMLVAFVCGFPIQGLADQADGNQAERSRLMGRWKIAVTSRAYVTGVPEIQCSEACNLGKEAVVEYNRTHQNSNLVWRQCYVFNQNVVLENVQPVLAAGNDPGLGNLRVRVNQLSQADVSSASRWTS